MPYTRNKELFFMDLYIKSLDKTQILNSYNFARNSDSVFSEIVTKSQYLKLKNKNTYVIEEAKNFIFYMMKELKVQENDIIFTNSYLIEPLFKKLNNLKFQNIKVISMQTDHHINKKMYTKKPKSVSTWYSTNVDFNTSDLIPIPLGLANEYSPKNIQKNSYDVLEPVEKKINKIYLNFEKNTNYFHRNKLQKALFQKNHVFSETNNLQIEEYLENLHQYKFILCPLGNGIDTHRIWETLYAGSIPIIPKHHNFESIFKSDIFLFKNLKMLSNSSYELKFTDSRKHFDYLLNIEYWINKISKDKVQNNYTTEILSFNPVNIKTYYFEYKQRESKRKKISTILRKIHNKVFN